MGRREFGLCLVVCLVAGENAVVWWRFVRFDEGRSCVLFLVKMSPLRSTRFLDVLFSRPTGLLLRSLSAFACGVSVVLFIY